MAAEETFLVIEDDAGVLLVLKNALEGPGRTVLISATGARALEQFERLKGDITLVIADVVLPDCSGPQVVRDMLQTRPDLRVLFLSGYPREFIKSYTEGLPFPLLMKPFTVGQLRAVVAQALEPLESSP